MKVRNSRWDHREHLKFEANRAGCFAAQHPQVRREMQHHDAEIEEALQFHADQMSWYLPALALANGWNWNPELGRYELPNAEGE